LSILLRLIGGGGEGPPQIAQIAAVDIATTERAVTTTGLAASTDEA